MERREFLIGVGAALLVPAFAAVSGCTSSTSSTSSDSFDVGSSPAQGPGGYPHTHVLRVLRADLANPPAGGVTYITGISEGHVHQVILSGTELVDIQSGKVVSKTSSIASGHQHVFAIAKP